MLNSSLTSLLDTISVERLRPYGVEEDDADLALAKYLWNTALSEALYPLLQTAEVAVRNHIHLLMLRDCGQPDWLTNPENRFQLGHRQLRRIAEAQEQLQKKRKRATPSALMAELSLGFWVSLFDNYGPFEQTWRRLLKARAFPNLTEGRTRSTISSGLNRIHELRNRVFHHEPIWNNPDLPQVHSELIALLKSGCDTTEGFIRPVDRFRAVHNAGPLAYRLHVQSL